MGGASAAGAEYTMGMSGGGGMGVPCTAGRYGVRRGRGRHPGLPGRPGEGPKVLGAARKCRGCRAARDFLRCENFLILGIWPRIS